MGLYAYASGAHRQVLTVLSHLGITCSYPTLTGTIKLPSGEELCAEETEEGTPAQSATDGAAVDANDASNPPQEQPEVQAEERRSGIATRRDEAGLEAGAPSQAEIDRERNTVATKGKY